MFRVIPVRDDSLFLDICEFIHIFEFQDKAEIIELSVWYISFFIMKGIVCSVEVTYTQYSFKPL